MKHKKSVFRVGRVEVVNLLIHSRASQFVCLIDAELIKLSYVNELLWWNGIFLTSFRLKSENYNWVGWSQVKGCCSPLKHHIYVRLNNWSKATARLEGALISNSLLIFTIARQKKISWSHQLKFNANDSQTNKQTAKMIKRVMRFNQPRMIYINRKTIFV